MTYGDISSRVETITPARAVLLLENNMPGNRRVSLGKVREYAMDMREGKFRLNGEPIIISRDSILLDGQHRLQACVDAGAPFDSVVTYGVSREAYKTIDTGRKRLPKDALVADGVTNAGASAAAVGIIITLQNNFKFGRTGVAIKITSEETSAFVADNPALATSATLGVNKNFRPLASAGVVTALHFLFSEKSKGQANEFFDKLMSGENLCGGNPILTLRERLIKNKTMGRKSAPMYDIVTWIIKAWNAIRRNDDLVLLRNATDGQAPTIV
jgi:hypothetical protein